jgi:hypothetical protein
MPERARERPIKIKLTKRAQAFVKASKAKNKAYKSKGKK